MTSTMVPDLIYNSSDNNTEAWNTTSQPTAGAGIAASQPGAYLKWLIPTLFGKFDTLWKKSDGLTEDKLVEEWMSVL